MSKSELTHLRKWSDGFLRGGQGKPAEAKNCSRRARSQSSDHPVVPCLITAAVWRHGVLVPTASSDGEWGEKKA